MMPVMNGEQFLQAIAQDVRWSSIPVVVAAAHASGKLPVFAALRKPYSADALLATLHRAVTAPGELRKAG